MKKRGFTLIELLAVIVILAIIALILVPIVSNVIDSSRKAAFKESVNGIIDSTNNYISDYVLEYKDELKNFPVVFTCDGTVCKTSDNYELTFKGNIPKSGTITIKKDGIEAEYITDGTYCAYGYKWNLVVEKSCSDVDVTKPTITGIQNGKVVTLIMTDNESGVDKYCATTESDTTNCEWITPSDVTNEVYTIASPGVWNFYVRDRKGNISDSINFETLNSYYVTTVTYHINGTTQTKELAYESDAISGAPAAELSGWALAGWREDTTASTSVLSTKAVEDGINLYAVFRRTINLYTTNSGTRVANPGTQVYNNGNYSNPTIAIANPSKSGATFRGWASVSGSATIANSSLASGLTISDNTERYAVWSYPNTTISGSATFSPPYDPCYHYHLTGTITSGIDTSKYSGAIVHMQYEYHVNFRGGWWRMYLSGGGSSVQIAGPSCDWGDPASCSGAQGNKDVTIYFSQTSGTTSLSITGESSGTNGGGGNTITNIRLIGRTGQ